MDHFGDLLEAAAQREFRSRGIFDKDGESGAGQVKALGGRGNGSGGLQKSGLAVGTAK